MDGNKFEQIAQELVKQKHLMDQLVAENRELRQQLAELRAGRGIFVEIAGSRFALRDDSPSPRDHLARTR
jgi:cell division protein FtsB